MFSDSPTQHRVGGFTDCFQKKIKPSQAAFQPKALPQEAACPKDGVGRNGIRRQQPAASLKSTALTRATPEGRSCKSSGQPQTIQSGWGQVGQQGTPAAQLLRPAQKQTASGQEDALLRACLSVPLAMLAAGVCSVTSPAKPTASHAQPPFNLRHRQGHTHHKCTP